MKKYYREIDILKGFAICSVILAHAIILYPVNIRENYEWCRYLYVWASSVNLSLFFAVSGFCFSYKGNYREYVWKKIKRLLIPYAVFNAADMVPRMMFPEAVRRSQTIAVSVRDAFLYGGEYWFLFALFVILALFPLVDRLVSGRTAAKAAVLLAALGLAYARGVTELFRLDSISYYFVFFFAGYLFRDAKERIFAGGGKRAAALSLPFVLAAWIALMAVRQNTEAYILGQTLKIMASAAGIVFCVLAAKLMTARSGSHMAGIGRYSLQLYLLNGFIVTASRIFIVNICGVESPVVIVIFIFLACLYVGYAVSKFIFDRFEILRLLTGIPRKTEKSA